MNHKAQHFRIKRLHRTAREWGFDAKALLSAARGFASTRRQRREFEHLRTLSSDSLAFPSHSSYVVYHDKADSAGVMKGHYFHQDLLVAQDIFRRNPTKHIDVGSRIDGFVSHVASFREITVIDIRPHSQQLPDRISFEQHDITSPDFDPLETADSVSCLHALEHFGLGRYGDPLDFDGWRRGLTGLRRLMTPGGILYLSVPTSQTQRIEFNAHRVFSIPFLRHELELNFAVERLDFVDDSGDLLRNQDPIGSEAERSFGAHYGCAIWTLRNVL